MTQQKNKTPATQTGAKNTTTAMDDGGPGRVESPKVPVKDPTPPVKPSGEVPKRPV